MRAVTKWMLPAMLIAGGAASFAQQPAPPAAPVPPAPAVAPAPPGPAGIAAPASPPEYAVEATDSERQLEAARERLDQAAREVAELSSRLGDRVRDRVQRFEFTPPRSMLGVQIDNRAGAGGAQVRAVSPGGAADQAGLKDGDVIVAIDGKDLSKDANPSRTLVLHMRELAPDQKVKLRVQRDGKTRELTATTRPPEPRFARMGEPMNLGAGDSPTPPLFRDMPGSGRPLPTWGMERHDFAGMELASLTPRLGSYFGVKSGVLVVRGGSSTFKLEDGDVITAIDGRAPTSAAHATRILRSYQRAEKLTITVMRDHKSKTLDVTIAGGPRPSRPGMSGRNRDGQIADD